MKILNYFLKVGKEIRELKVDVLVARVSGLSEDLRVRTIVNMTFGHAKVSEVLGESGLIEYAQKNYVLVQKGFAGQR